jgi:hypothetical protein
MNGDVFAQIWVFLVNNKETFAAVGALLGGAVAVWKVVRGKPDTVIMLDPSKLDPALMAPAEPISNEFNVSPIYTHAMLRKVYALDEYMYKYELEDAAQHKMTVDIENISFEKFEEWWLAYPNGFLIASQKGEPVAVIGIFPVTHEWSQQFLRREVDEHDLTGDIIRNASGKFYYVSGISTNIKTEGLAKHLPRFLLPAVFEWLRTHVDKFGHEDIMLVSEGSSEHGQNILERVKFMLESAATEPGQRPRYSKKTTISKVKRFLLENPWMKLCPNLKALVHSTLD